MKTTTQAQAALLLLSALGLAGCSSLYGPSPSATEGTVMAAADSDVICTRDVASGTRFLRTVCMSKADRAAQAENAQKAADSLRAPPPEIRN